MNWLYILFVIFLAIGVLLFLYGFKKKSVMAMFLGGIVFITPLFYLINWNVVVPFVPPVSMAIAYFTKKKLDTI
ncbi:hypothetical protein WMZ97_05110 [Lentibacillus sp. N15]|uniref:hypothetical protein n=1 Tax=Lentibacillus songyuanensis TaxID=3136161 RepID=UPI0031BA1FFC